MNLGRDEAEMIGFWALDCVSSVLDCFSERGLLRTAEWALLLMHGSVYNI